MVNHISVIGGGIIGLTTAVALQEQLEDVQVTVITEKLSPETTGDVSAGLWMPYILSDTPRENIINWAGPTYKLFLKLWQSGQAADCGVSLLPLFYLSLQPPDTGPSFWKDIVLGYNVLNTEEMKQVCQETGTRYTWGFQFMTFTCEPSKFLPYLKTKFVNNGGSIIQQKVKSIEEVANGGYDMIINCTGLGAKELLGDDDLTPARGQVMRVSAPWQFYVLLDDDEPGNYVIPNMESVILGGTHQNDWNLNIDVQDTRHIKQGCYRLIPGLKNADVLKEQVGLRPCRTEVCLKKGDIIVKNGKTTQVYVIMVYDHYLVHNWDHTGIEQEWNSTENSPIQRGPSARLLSSIINIISQVVHNYGHGGSGVTLCWGCAQAVANIVKTILNKNKNSLFSKL